MVAKDTISVAAYERGKYIKISIDLSCKHKTTQLFEESKFNSKIFFFIKSLFWCFNLAKLTYIGFLSGEGLKCNNLSFDPWFLNTKQYTVIGTFLHSRAVSRKIFLQRTGKESFIFYLGLISFWCAMWRIISCLEGNCTSGSFTNNSLPSNKKIFEVFLVFFDILSWYLNPHMLKVRFQLNF